MQNIGENFTKCIFCLGQKNSKLVGKFKGHVVATLQCGSSLKGSIPEK